MPSAADLTLVDVNGFKFVFNKIVLCLSMIYDNLLFFFFLKKKLKRHEVGVNFFCSTQKHDPD